MENFLEKLPEVFRSTKIESPEEYRENVQLYSFRYRSDDCEVEGYGAFPQKWHEPRPGLVFNRGGNREFSPLTPDKICKYAAGGYVTLGSQYRGNCGGTGHEEFGGRDVNDVICLIDILLKLPCVRKEGVYMAGRSRGGMMTYLACTRDRRIRAAGIMAGIADSVMMYNTRGDDMKQVYHELLGGGPDKLPEAFRERSAVCWAEKIIPPLILCHGTADDKVVFQQAEKMDQALTAAGKEHRFVVYPGAGHSLTGTDAAQQVMKWFAEHPLSERK